MLVGGWRCLQGSREVSHSPEQREWAWDNCAGAWSVILARSTRRELSETPDVCQHVGCLHAHPNHGDLPAQAQCLPAL